MKKEDFVIFLKRFGHVEQMPNGIQHVTLNLNEIAVELEQLFNKNNETQKSIKNAFEVLSLAEDGSIIFRYNPTIKG